MDSRRSVEQEKRWLKFGWQSCQDRSYCVKKINKYKEEQKYVSEHYLNQVITKILLQTLTKLTYSNNIKLNFKKKKKEDL